MGVPFESGGATKLDFSLQPIAKSLCKWGNDHAAELMEIDEKVGKGERW